MAWYVLRLSGTLDGTTYDKILEHYNDMILELNTNVRYLS